MQLIAKALAGFLFIALFFACKKDSTSGPGTNGQVKGEPTNVGAPDDQPIVLKMIGPAGGDIISNDGRLKVTIPAGAFSSNREISIQSISNFNPMALGQAYRLEPHGVEFSKPVTIEFTYTDEQIANTIPEALGIAYQDSNRIWQKVGGVMLNKSNKTVQIKTTHFSDWSFFETFFLQLSSPVVKVKSAAELLVYTTEDLFAPLEPLKEGEQMPMGKKVELAAEYIKEWKLAGAGNLNANGGRGTYTAPAEVPASPNPVAITVTIDLKKPDKLLLVGHIEIIDDFEGIEVSVAGGPWKKKLAGPAVKMGDGYYAMADTDGDTEGSYVLVMWEGEEGLHTFRSPDANTGTYAHYIIEGGDSYTCSYKNIEDEVIPSGGGVTVTSMEDEDGFITGTFDISPAGHGFDLRSKSRVQGRFRVKKGW